MKQKNGIAGIYLLGALAAQAGNYTVIKKGSFEGCYSLKEPFLCILCIYYRTY